MGMGPDRLALARPRHRPFSVVSVPVKITHITSADHSAPGSSYTPSAAGPVNIRITVQGHRSSDLTRDLFSWLAHDPSLRGLLSIVDGEPPAFALGCADTAL